jgi:hypothetical protein
MQADIANKNADTAQQDEQRRWESVKAMFAAFGAGREQAVPEASLAVAVACMAAGAGLATSPST